MHEHFLDQWANKIVPSKYDLEHTQAHIQSTAGMADIKLLVIGTKRYP